MTFAAKAAAVGDNESESQNENSTTNLQAENTLPNAINGDIDEEKSDDEKDSDDDSISNAGAKNPNAESSATVDAAAVEEATGKNLSQTSMDKSKSGSIIGAKDSPRNSAAGIAENHTGNSTHH